MPTDDDRPAPLADGSAEPRPADDDRQPSELSPGRKRAFTVAMLLLPVLFFLLLEGGLRLVGYGASYPLFVDVEGQPDLLMPSREVAKRYFTNQAAVPTPSADFFPREKGEDVIRIVAQGGSSTAGYPFYRGASFPQVLGTRLELAYPGQEVEVINTAMAAVNSYTLLDFADEILEIQPDAVVIYAGHNEFYGALGAASTESFGRNPAVVRAYLALRDWRTVQLVRSLIGGVAGLFAEREAGERPSNTLMARMIGEQSVPLGGEIYQAGLRQFESNLDRLLARYAEAGVPVYVSTLASNIRDQRPSSPRPRAARTGRPPPRPASTRCRRATRGRRCRFWSRPSRWTPSRRTRTSRSAAPTSSSATPRPPASRSSARATSTPSASARPRRSTASSARPPSATAPPS